MQMDEGPDTDAMLLKKTIAIAPSDTASSLHDKLAHVEAEIMLETLPCTLSSDDHRAMSHDKAHWKIQCIVI